MTKGIITIDHKLGVVVGTIIVNGNVLETQTKRTGNNSVLIRIAMSYFISWFITKEVCSKIIERGSS